MSNPTIAVDIDGVVFNPQEDLLASANAAFNTDYKLEDVVDFDYRNFPLRVRNHFMYCWDSMDYYTLTPVEGFYDGLSILQSLGRVIAVSAPMRGHLHVTSKWGRLSDIFGDKNVVLTKGKDNVNADILIDDAPKYIDQWLDTERPIVIQARPWNEEYLDKMIQCIARETPYKVATDFSNAATLVEELLTNNVPKA